MFIYSVMALLSISNIFFFLDFMIENYIKESIFCSQIFGGLLCGLHFQKDFRLAPRSVSPNACGRK